MKVYTEDFGQKLATGPVKVCQLERELDLVLEIYRSIRPARVLELGTAEGGTLYHWLQNAEPWTHVVTVDLPDPRYEPSEHLYDSWLPDGVAVTQIRGDTHDPVTRQACKEHGPFDWLFIDAAHTYEDARQDWDDYAPLMRPGGMVLLHDISLVRTYDDGSEAGVWRLWREIQASGYLTRELRADMNVPAYGIGVVRV